MDTGGPSNRTTVSTQGLPGWLQQQLKGATSGLLSSGRDLSGLLMDPSQYRQIGGTLQGIATGGQLNPQDTEAGKALINSIYAVGNQNLGQNLAQLRSQFANAGQNLSGPLMQAETQAITNANIGENANVSEALFNLFGQGQQNQLAALQGAQQYQITPEQLFTQLAGLESKGKQMAPMGSWMSMLGSMLNPMSGIMGGK